MNQLPEILLQDLQQVKGFDKEALIAAHQLPAVTSVRLNPNKASAAFADNEQVPWCANGRYLAERPVFTVDPLYHAGAYYVQEASSMFLHHILSSHVLASSGLRVLDLCAAPGGKSTLIASFLGEDDLLVSNEVIRTRATILEENMTRWGYMNTWVVSNDPKDIGRLESYFDVIVVDAPCSGSGLFRKDARALDEWSEGNVLLCSQRQQRILADVWPSLKEDGIVIYATCSYSPQEDEEILDWLSENFEVKGLPVALEAEWGVVETVSSKGMHGYRFSPDKVKGEGFFIAALQKKETTREPKPLRYKTLQDKKAQEQTKHLLDTEYLCLQLDKDNYVAIHPSHEADYHTLKQFVYLRKTGVQLGTPTPKEWLPSHDVALSIHRAATLPKLELNKEQALKFLKKEDFALPEGTHKGWILLTYNGLGIGWIKALGNRFNNYLPKHWRIRMEISDMDWA
ncbi:MAG: RNA methyltransferase [Flavipsychrobacter sp.]|nr:RNA methyltransferase [Flavipsychrobacter sp.]